ncbi:DUF2877 domain-containing protein [Aeromicrobium sp. CF3.5]|uniref:DUF2877 domain-containing protein n=1 Tax=Aeromicrobium sp. CF3.5 TaxID=3373078 RepID=UPI003EE6716E
MPARTVVAAAAPLWVRRHVDGPRQQAIVVHRGPHAIYAAVPDGASTRCVGVLSARSSFVPCGMQTTWPDLSDLLAGESAPGPGDAVSIGGGAFEIGTTSIRIGRTLDATVPVLDATAAGVMAQMLRSSLAGREEAVRAELSSDSLDLLADADPRAVAMLLGRGSGLTPVGDDVLCGWLAVIAATLADEPHALALEVAVAAEQATTLLSATLLDRAVSGDVLPEFRQLLVQLRHGAAHGTTDQLDSCVDSVLAIGHTSGAGMLLGCLIALDHLTHAHPTARNSHP